MLIASHPVVSQDTQYTAVSNATGCGVCFIDDSDVGGIDDFGVRALLCVLLCIEPLASPGQII